jgi:small subunit ribosomal protein S16
MAVKIRLARTGKKNAPFYRIVAIDSRRKRDGKSLEILGAYNPLRGEIIHLHTDRIQAWVNTGAIVTDAVKRLQKMYEKTAKPAVAA